MLNFPNTFNRSFLVTVITLTFVFLTSNPSVEAQRKPKPKPKSVPMKISVKTIEGYTAVPDSPPKPKTFGLKIEKYVSNIDVAADGTSVHTIEVQDRAITEVATFALRKVERTYNRDLEDVDFSDLYILKADGKKVPIAQTAV